MIFNAGFGDLSSGRGGEGVRRAEDEGVSANLSKSDVPLWALKKDPTSDADPKLESKPELRLDCGCRFVDEEEEKKDENSSPNPLWETPRGGVDDNIDAVSAVEATGAAECVDAGFS